MTFSTTSSSPTSLRKADPFFRVADATSTLKRTPSARIFHEPRNTPLFKEVVVPLDGSPYAEHALPWGIQLAKLAGVRIRIVHVHLKMEPRFHSRRLDLYDHTDRLLRRPMEDYMTRIARQIARASSVGVAVSMVDEREVNAGLLTLAGNSDDFVVMATRGRSHLWRALVGSSLDSLLSIRQATVLHVPGYKCPVNFTARPSMRHALVPLDGTLGSEQIVRHVARLNKLVDGRGTLLRVIHSTERSAGLDGSTRDLPPELKRTSRGGPREAVNLWKPELPSMRTSIVWSHYSAAQEILSQAIEREADYVAIATRDRGRLSRLLRPGVLDYLVRRLRIPILVAKQIPIRGIQ
jgi:nucleotide-binding universal stress UspA family protein